MNHDTSTTKGKMAVMAAADNRAKIECAPWETENWRSVEKPLWNWDDYNYRIKPEPPKLKHRTWTAEEAIGQKVRDKATGRFCMITEADPSASTARLSQHWVDLLTLLHAYETLDGKPCGVEVIK